MSPRERKRDRVLKRRRESKKKKQHDDEKDDSLEKSYNAARGEERFDKKAKIDVSSVSQGQRGGGSQRSVSEKAKSFAFAEEGEKSSSTDEDAVATTQEAPQVPLSKEERQRLKNQKRKALRKQKKARKEEISKQVSEEREQETRKSQQQMLLKKKAAEEKETGCFKSLRLGVRYRDVIIGKGPAVQNRKKLRVSYKLRAEHCHGKIIDSSPDFRFRVGKGEVVKGWDIGVMEMRQGGLRHLIVPPQAGYGRRNVGAGPGGLLFFEITLISC